MIAGVCGPTPQALGEAELALSLDYDAAFLSLSALRDVGNDVCWSTVAASPP